MGWQLFRDRTNGAVHRGDHRASTREDPDETFWASPVGRATRARMRGDRFFQIALDDEALAAYAEDAAHDGSGRRARRAGDLLGQIEELGWRLEHVSWWRGETAGTGRVEGVYLFHAVSEADAAPAPGTANGVTHAPSHRRNDP